MLSRHAVVIATQQRCHSSCHENQSSRSCFSDVAGDQVPKPLNRGVCVLEESGASAVIWSEYPNQLSESHFCVVFSVIETIGLPAGTPNRFEQFQGLCVRVWTVVDFEIGA